MVIKYFYITDVFSFQIFSSNFIFNVFLKTAIEFDLI